MLKYIEITNDNIEFATKVQMKIFPNESAYEHFKFTIERDLEYEKYYLVYDKNTVIGVTGLYSNEDINITNSLWLGWFGVLEKFRSKGYGKQILIDTIEMAKRLSKKYPIKYFRLYTSERDDKIAQPLYEKVMDFKEYYNNPEDINYDGTCLIYTKGLNNNKPIYWNNIFLNLREIVEEEKKSNERYKSDGGLNDK